LTIFCIARVLKCVHYIYLYNYIGFTKQLIMGEW